MIGFLKCFKENNLTFIEIRIKVCFPLKLSNIKSYLSHGLDYKGVTAMWI